MLLICLCLLQASSVASVRAAVNPMQKVLQLVSKMQQEVIGDGEVQQKAYKEFAKMCQQRSQELQHEIKLASSEVEDMKATSDKATDDEGEADTQIEELTASLSNCEADLKAATLIRAKEFAEFQESQKDMIDTVSQMERAIFILEKQKQGSTSFAQEPSSAVNLQQQRSIALTQALSAIVDASFINSADASSLAAFLQTSENEADGTDTQFDAASDSFTGRQTKNSDSIVDLLEGLLEKAQASLQQVRVKESASSLNFVRFKGSLERKLAVSNKELNEVKKEKAEAGQTRAQSEGDLVAVKTDLAEDSKALGTLHHECMTRAQDFEDEAKSRDDELKALVAAKKLIQEISGKAAFITYGDSAPTSFLQTRSGYSIPPTMQAAQMVRELGQMHKSPALMQMAHKMESVVRSSMVAGTDPFRKVKSMLSEMLNKLVRQMQQEATHKVYCDKEMAETKKHKAVKETVEERIATKVDTQTSRSMNLKQNVAELQKELLANQKTQRELDKMRQEEHSAFMKTKPEMEMGLEGIKKALQILREYYSQDEEKSHDAASGGGSGIIAMLEVVESDFEKGLASLNAEEESAQAAYKEQSNENAKTKAIKAKFVTLKTKKAKALDKSTSESAGDLDGVQTELAAINEYWAKIQQECVAKPDSYAERRKRQEQTLQGLQDAAQILEGKAALIQGSRHMRGSTLLRQGADIGDEGATDAA